jgi:putative transposase
MTIGSRSVEPVQCFCFDARPPRRPGWFYKARRRDDSVLRKRIREIAETRVRYGCQRIFTLLRREGWRDNHKRVHRLYRLEGLNLRNKRPRRNRTAAHRLERPQLSSIHQCWNGPP